ncbi:DUF423 domain-containing protein [Sunxiuqinia indica]|uniref:DUF423 domain-containing protein n=1 Tax=Sunxiuqinia indica TaxID=2692584 RepID=UPI00135BCB49|nr:DUF423 domain-containing protein [Sunxiuqinia indica]
MKTWNLKVKSNPQETSKKLDSALGSIGGFVFRMDTGTKDSIIFKVRKRSLNYLNFIRENQIVVNGKILETDSENETDLEISFSQHFLTILYVSFFVGLGLLALILGISNNATMLYGGILLVIGIVLWIDVRKNSEKNVQKYKTLISEILE